MSWLPLPYIQLESARTNGTDYFDTQWNAGYGFGPAFAGAIFTNGGYLFGAMTSEDSDDKFALQFQDGKYILYYRNKTAESPADYELGEPHYFYFYSGGGESCTWNIDGVSMPTLNFDSGLMQNPMSLPVYVGAVNVGGEAQNLSDVQIGYLYFAGSSGTREWRQCKTEDGQFGFYLYSGAAPTFVEKPDFTYGGVIVTATGTQLTLVGAPTKKDYKLGEPFDITGATVYLNLDDGTQRDVTDEVSPNSRSYTYFNSNKIYRSGYVPYLYYRYNPVGVEYSSFQFGGREYSVTLPQTLYYTVSSDSPVESIEVTKLPDKTEYLIKEYFDSTGMVVTGHLENGDTAEIGDSTSYSGISYPLSTAGTFDVAVSWYDGSKYLYADPFQITVKNAVDKLNITLPTKSEYSIGEKFSPTGITVTALYLDGTERPIYNFFVDSSKFDSTKEGGYAITVKATVDEKEYTETITVYVFGEPKRLEDLLGTTEGMTAIRNNVKNDSGKDTISGVDWFVFDGNTASKIYVSGDNFISFNGTTEHIRICRRDGATYYVYSQVGKLDNGHRFLKIRVEGYTYWSSSDAQYALKYELFLFDDNSMFLNILQAPTNTSYLGTSELLYGTTHTTFTVEAGKAQVFRFYTTDAAQGKPWFIEHSLEELLDTTEGMEVVRNNAKGDDTVDEVVGVPWFVYDGTTCEKIYVSGNSWIDFGKRSGTQTGGSSTGNLNIFRRDGAVYYIYRQDGRLSNGHKFFKLRVEGYTRYSSQDEQYAYKYELFLFDDGGMFLNIVQFPTGETASLDNFLSWSDGELYFSPEENKNKIGFYTTDAEAGKPWISMYGEYDFTKTAVYEFSARPTKREYNLGDSFDATAFTVIATHVDGSVEIVSDFTATSETFDGQKEGRYPVTVTAQINGQEYTAETLVAVYGEAHDILDLLNTTDGMNTANWPSLDASKFGDVSWFTYDGKPVEQIGIRSRREIYFNTQKVLSICTASSVASNNAFIQEGILVNGHKFLKLRCEWTSTNVSFPTFELFLFDDNSMYLNLIRPASAEGTTTATQLTWSDGQIEVPVTADEFQKFSFYTDNPSEGKPWTMEADYHNFIKEKIHKLTVVNGSGSGDYLEGETVTATAEDREGYNFSWWTASVEGFLGRARIKNYNKSGDVRPATVGNTLFYYYHSASEEPPVYDGWDFIGKLEGKGSDGQSNSYTHFYVKTVESENDSSSKLPCYEIEGAKEIVLQEYTKQESVVMRAGVKLTCTKRTNDFYLWYVYSAQFWSGERWTITPDVARIIPEDGTYNIAIEDANIPAVQFTIQQTRETNTPASLAGFLVETYNENDKTLRFAMPAEDVTLTANYSPKLGRIEITEKPFKLNYALNERFDRSGMVVTAYYADGTQETVKNYLVSDLESFSVGVKELTVRYTDGIDTATATLTVNVGISGITITKRPDKTAYKLDEPFDPTGLEVSFVYADNSTYPTEDYKLTGFGSYYVGIKTITATCVVDGTPYTAQFSVTVTSLGDNPFSGYNENRTLRIHFINGEYDDITGDEIESESMSLTESLGNDKNFRFGGCISTQFSVNIFSEQFLNPDVFPEGDIEAYLEAGDESLKIFTGTIDSAERTGGISKRKIISYDCLKRKGTIKLKKWYKSLTFPIKQKDFRKSLFEYVGIEQIETTLKYDYAYVPDNMNVDSLTFLSLVKDMCLCNMVFGHINADGEFEYLDLQKNGFVEEGERESYSYRIPEDVIPDENVISATFKEGKIWNPKWFWINPDPHNPYSENEEPESSAAYNGNIYFVRNSYMIGDTDWIQKAYYRSTITYDDIIQEDYILKYHIIFGPYTSENDSSMLYLAREYSLTTPGNFLRKIGTNIAFNCIKYLEDGTPVTWTINSYIMSRTITGIRSLRDVYTAKNSAYNEEAYGAAKDLRDVTDAVKDIKDKMPKSTKEDGDDDVTIEPFKGVETPKGDAESSKAKEEPNKLYVYPDGTARYNGTTISGSGGGGGGTGGGFDVQSVTSLPSNPDPNTIYLIQGEVVVE